MPKILWTYEKCKEFAKLCKTRTIFWEKYPHAAKVSKINGWDIEFFGKTLNKNSGYWTKEKCFEESKKYKYMTEFRDNNPTVFYKCKKNNWLIEINWLINNIKNFDLISKIHLIYAYIV